MNTYMAITITNYGMKSSLSYGHIYFYSEKDKLETCKQVSMIEALKEMAKLAKKLNKVPTFTINQFNPVISYRELRGYLD